MEKIYRVQMNAKGMPNFSTAVEIKPKQGEWIDNGYYANCSNCGAKSGIQFDGVEPIPRKSKWCPGCGAMMKGAGECKTGKY